MKKPAGLIRPEVRLNHVRDGRKKYNPESPPKETATQIPKQPHGQQSARQDANPVAREITANAKPYRMSFRVETHESPALRPGFRFEVVHPTGFEPMTF